MRTGFQGLGRSQLEKLWAARATDPRPRVETGFPEFDELLNRGGLAPGELVMLGGRTHTRKTTVMLNMVERLLRRGVPVGVVGLDEPTASYIAKLASVFTRHEHQWLEDTWAEGSTQKLLADEFWPWTEKLSLTTGARPDFDQLTGWLEMADQDCGETPRVVFIDYLTRLARDPLDGGDVQRVQRLAEDLADWTNENDVITVCMSQVSRNDEWGKYHGATPMTLESLKYGGEEPADIVLGAYRPALDPIGNMPQRQAESVLGNKFDQDEYDEAVSRVKRYASSTFLQLLKNRPGTHLLPEGIELRSPSLSLYLKAPSAEPEADGRRDEDDAPDNKVVKLHG